MSLAIQRLGTPPSHAPSSCKQLYIVEIWVGSEWRALTVGTDPLLFDDANLLKVKLERSPPLAPYRIVRHDPR
jgi:hypothetical protein